MEKGKDYKEIHGYLDEIERLRLQEAKGELNRRGPMQALLKAYASMARREIIGEKSMHTKKGGTIRPDGNWWGRWAC